MKTRLILLILSVFFILWMATDCADYRMFIRRFNKIESILTSDTCKYKQLNIQLKHDISLYKDSLRKSDSIVNWHVEFDKQQALNK
jgi:hypothetical protein